MSVSSHPDLDQHAIASLAHQALDGSTEPVAIYTAEPWVIASTIVYVNEAFASLSGFGREYFVGHSALLLAGARPTPTSMDSILPHPGCDELVMRAQKQRPDGSSFDVDVTVSPLRNAVGAVTHYLARYRKVEPTHAAPGQLDDVRDASFSQLAAGVSYELEGDVSTCLCSLRSALDGAAAAGAAALVPALEAAHAAAVSMAATLRGLASFTREDLRPETSVNVHDALELAVRLSGAVVRDRAVVQRRYAAVSGVKATLPRLARLFTHLLRNAGEAIPPSMPHANHVTLETREDTAGTVTVVITDTGVGIEREDLPFVCDPFFTTKKDAATHGLGLTAVRAEISDLGGTLEVESVVGYGTSVRVTLPADDLREAEPPALEPSTREPLVTRLLSVADTLSAARETARSFVDAGAVQVTLATWDDALDCLAMGSRFHLVVCDMNGRGVRAFRLRLRELSPESLPQVFNVRSASREESGVFERAVAAERQATGTHQ